MTRSSTYSVVDERIRKIEMGNADPIEFLFLEDEFEFCFDWQESVLAEFLNRLLRMAVQDIENRVEIFSLVEAALIHRRGPAPKGLVIQELIRTCRTMEDDSLAIHTLKLCALLEQEGEVRRFVEEKMNAENEKMRKTARETIQFWNAR